MAVHRYQPPPAVDLPDRSWPSRQITHAPLWCAVDLRDGNQALIEPMNLARKQAMFDLLVDMGYKEIEVGFPAAGKVEFEFIRRLVTEDRIPDDVTIQVITQGRPELIERTFEAIAGVPRAIVHLYNSTSALQRRVVFGMDRAGITGIAVDSTRLIRHLAESMSGSRIRFEYTPESFTETELDFALDICGAVLEEWPPTADDPVIVNLPATVERSSPNVYADQVEWMGRNLPRREHICLSVHPHNDRGTGVAAAELALMAGADRVEGCLFGNGERTGNVCLVTLGMNLLSHGVDPQLDFSDIDRIRRTVEQCNQLPVHPRHPYGGELVYTAFSGSHQDAIKKGLEALGRAAAAAGVPVGELPWGVPYLPIDPKDVGRTYEAVIRVNSQSGKGGPAYLLKSEHGIDLPRGLQIDFARTIQEHSDEEGSELTPELLWKLFQDEYLTDAPRVVVDGTASMGGGDESVRSFRFDGARHRLEHDGEDLPSGFVGTLRELGVRIDLLQLTGQPTPAGAAAYAECRIEDVAVWGVGLADDVGTAGLRAIASAVNRAAR